MRPMTLDEARAFVIMMGVPKHEFRWFADPIVPITQLELFVQHMLPDQSQAFADNFRVPTRQRNEADYWLERWAYAIHRASWY